MPGHERQDHVPAFDQVLTALGVHYTCAICRRHGRGPEYVRCLGCPAWICLECAESDKTPTDPTLPAVAEDLVRAFVKDE